MKKIKKSLFLSLFIKIAAILAAFVLVLIVANSTFLYDFYFLKEKNSLISAASRLQSVDVSNSEQTGNVLEEIANKNGFQIEIYDKSGRTIYTTESGKMMDFLLQDRPQFSMQHSPLRAIETWQIDAGTVFQTAAYMRDGTEYLQVIKNLEGGYTAELKIRKETLANNAAVTGEFTVIIALVFLAVSLVWTFFTARSIARPISSMNEITKKMAALDFGERVKVNSHDEIGQLAESVNNMAESLSAALDELQKANAQLTKDIELERQLDTMRKEFVANVSHELKTPISIISGYAEGLKLNVNSIDKDRYCETIIDEAERMNRLVLSILELSRYESGQISAQRSDFNLRDMVADSGARIFGGANLEFINDLPEDLYINADSSGIEQVLKAFFENALVHTASGGKVRVYSGEQNGEIRVGVHNTGSHIEEEKLPYIWQSFYRGDTSHKRESNRFGLGLSIVAAIMKMHGTKYGAFNTNDGVCFWIEVKKLEETACEL